MVKTYLNKKVSNKIKLVDLIQFYVLTVNILLLNLLATSIGYNDLILYWSLSIIIIYLFYDLFYIYKYSLINIRIFLLAGVLLWYYLPILSVERSKAEIAHFVIINYSLILILVSKRFKVVFDKIYLIKNFKRLYFLILIYTCYKIYSIDENLIVHILKSRSESTADDFINLNTSILDSIITVLDVVYQLVVSYGFYVSFLKKKWKPTIFFLILIVFISIETGFRTLMGFLLFPVIFSLLAKFKFAKISVSFILLLLFAQFMLSNRTANNEIFENLSAVEAAVQTSDLYSETNFAIENIDRFKNVKQNDFFIFSTFLIPRAIFPIKPVPEVVREFTYLKWGIDILNTGGNVFPGIYMNFYLSYGFFIGGLFLVSFQYFILFFFKIIYKHNNSLFFLSLFCANLLLNFRSNSPYFYFFTILPFAMITFYTKKTKKNEVSSQS